MALGLIPSLVTRPITRSKGNDGDDVFNGGAGTGDTLVVRGAKADYTGNEYRGHDLHGQGQ